MIYKFFDKKTGSGVSVNEQLAEELHKTVIKNFKRRKVESMFKEHILTAQQIQLKWGHCLQIIKGVKYLVCVIDVFTKTVLNAFIETVNESNCKPSKLWVDQRREFYNKNGQTIIIF